MPRTRCCLTQTKSKTSPAVHLVGNRWAPKSEPEGFGCGRAIWYIGLDPFKINVEVILRALSCAAVLVPACEKDRARDQAD